jgi:hypothetical protein
MTSLSERHHYSGELDLLELMSMTKNWVGQYLILGYA